MKRLPLSYVEIAAECLRGNVQAFRACLRQGTKIAAVVKANAYGHGLPEVVRAVADTVDYFQVDDLDELRRLRAVTDRPALLLGYVGPDEIGEALRLGCEPALIDAAQLGPFQAAAGRFGAVAGVHIAVDAYLGREGTLPEALPELLDGLRRCPSLKAAGIYAHFANIEDTTDPSHARKQLGAYAQAKERLRADGCPDVLTHIAATSGILAYEQAAGENGLVRLGIGMYGLWPSQALRERHGPALDLRPALRWVTQVAQVKELPAGHSIGYGLTYVTAERTRVALIPQGYSDGYDRGLSNRGEVLVRGRRCPVRGRVAMNMFVVDVSRVPEVRPGDEAVLLGGQGEDRVTAEELAEATGTINYEVVARISPLLPRRTV